MIKPQKKNNKHNVQIKSLRKIYPSPLPYSPNQPKQRNPKSKPQRNKTKPSNKLKQATFNQKIQATKKEIN